MSGELDDDCFTCGEGWGEPGECPESRRPCGHHCNHLCTHDRCCWCPAYIDDDGEVIQARLPVPAALTSEEDRPVSDKASDYLHVLRLWMSGWRPEGDEWGWGWDRTKRQPLTAADRAALTSEEET